jgi:hypothetical protein
LPRFKWPRAATIIAFVALFAALGGGSAVAAKRLITSSDIKNGTIKAADLSRGAKSALKGQRGAPGPQGLPGPAGAQGPPGPAAVARVGVVEATVTVLAGRTDFAIAFCPSGQSAIGGGYTAMMGAGSEVWSNERTDSGLGWVAHSWNFNDFTSGTLTVQAYCAPTGVAVAARAGSSVRDADRRAEARKHRVRLRLADTPSAAAAGHCGRGYTHARIGGERKCLRRGQYCARRYERQYHRYGFHCHRSSRDRNGDYHLT